MAVFDTSNPNAIMAAYNSFDANGKRTLSKDAALSLLDPLSGGSLNAARFFANWLNTNGAVEAPNGGGGGGGGGETRDVEDRTRILKEVLAQYKASPTPANWDELDRIFQRFGLPARQITDLVGPRPGPTAAPRAGVPILSGDALGGDPVPNFLQTQSGTLGGRQGLFGNFTASQFGDLPSRFAPSIAAQFSPLSAAFSLQRLGPGGANQQLDDFRGFLGTSPQALGSQGFDAALDAIAPLFDPNAGALGADVQGRVNQFTAAGTQFVPNVIRQSFGNSGFGRRILDNLIAKRIAAFRDATPGIGNDELFAAFLGNRQLVGQGFTR